MGCFSSKTADHGPIRPNLAVEASGIPKQIKIEKNKDTDEGSRVYTVGPSNLTDKAGDDSAMNATGLKDPSEAYEDINEPEKIVKLWLEDSYAEAKTRILPKL